jgi:hypothetical protein
MPWFGLLHSRATLNEARHDRLRAAGCPSHLEHPLPPLPGGGRGPVAPLHRVRRHTRGGGGLRRQSQLQGCVRGGGGRLAARPAAAGPGHGRTPSLRRGGGLTSCCHESRIRALAWIARVSGAAPCKTSMSASKIAAARTQQPRQCSRRSRTDGATTTYPAASSFPPPRHQLQPHRQLRVGCGGCAGVKTCSFVQRGWGRASRAVGRLGAARQLRGVGHGAAYALAMPYGQCSASTRRLQPRSAKTSRFLRAG